MAGYLRTLLAIAVLFVAVPASASVIILKFDGIGHLAPAGGFSNGGVGTNDGIEFGPATLAALDEEAGDDTLMSFLDANGSKVPAGFDTGFSSFDRSSAAASLNVYEDLDPTGNALGALSLAGPDNPIAFDDITGSADPVRPSVIEAAITLGEPKEKSPRYWSAGF